MTRSLGDEAPGWVAVVQRVPFPLRIATSIWLLVSLVAYLAPSLAKDISPAWALFLALPMMLIALGMGLFILWRGAQTIIDTVNSVTAGNDPRNAVPKRSLAFVGGMGALQIYMMLYILIGFWLASITGTYVFSVILSCFLGAGLGFALFVRKPHPSNVKMFLGSGLFVTILFAFLMATVAVPPA